MFSVKGITKCCFKAKIPKSPLNIKKTGKCSRISETDLPKTIKNNNLIFLEKQKLFWETKY